MRRISSIPQIPQIPWIDSVLSVFIITTLTVAGAMACNQRNPRGGDASATADGQDRFFDSDGVRIRYVISGGESAEPIVFINGFPERLEVWSGTVNSESLKGYRLIRFDPRVLGLSDKPHDQRKYGKEMAEDVVRLLDYMKIRKAHVVGYSMGAWITLKLVTVHPERVITATLGGNAGLHPAQAMRQQIIADAIEGKDIAMAVMNLPFPDGRKLSGEEAKETAQVLRTVGSQYAAELDPMAVAPMMRGFADLVVTDEELKNNRTPVLAIYSNEDDAGRPLAGEITALGRRMLNVSVFQIQNANHGNARSKPQFVEALAEFLAKHTPTISEREVKR